LPSPLPPFGFDTSRREALGLFTAGASALAGRGAVSLHLRAVAFDAFVLFDPRGIVRRARPLMGEKADTIISTASNKLFAYTWFYTSAARYMPFEMLAQSALRFAAGAQGVSLSDAEYAYLVHGYSELDVWPDVAAGLQTMRDNKVRLTVLSNMSEGPLRSSLRRNGIEDKFESVLSTDLARQYKPARAAYQLGVSALGLPARSIGFAASAAWDAAGASWFGYPTVWVNRLHAPDEFAPVSATTGDAFDSVIALAGS